MPDVERRQSYTAVIGDTVVLRCRPNVSMDVDWHYWVLETSPPYCVYSNRAMYKRFEDRMSVDGNSSFDLVINNVTVGDAGQYICVEELGLGAKHIAKLTVNGKN